MTTVDVEALRQRAASGDGDAQMALAWVFDQEGRHDIALQWLQRAADSGHLPSLTALGVRLLIGRGAPRMPSQGAQMVSLAADSGDAQACGVVAVLAAAGQTRPQSWSTALEYLFRSAQLGDARARQQIAILVRDPGIAARLLDPAGDAPWAHARADIDLAAWLRLAPGVKVSDWPRIIVFENFLPPAVCDWLVNLARPVLAAARVHHPEERDGAVDPLRSNSGIGFTLLESDVLMQIVNARIATASGAPTAYQEATNILHYATGQEYKPHFDFMDPDLPQFTEIVRRDGQRIATLLVYLNDGFDGGETHFPVLDMRYKGRPGDAILFLNVDGEGVIDRRTLHAGLAPTQGEKWLLSKWIRDRPAAQF